MKITKAACASCKDLQEECASKDRRIKDLEEKLRNHTVEAIANGTFIPKSERPKPKTYEVGGLYNECFVGYSIDYFNAYANEMEFKIQKLIEERDKASLGRIFYEH